MQAFSILSAIVAGLRLAKKYWPVLTVILAMLTKIASGDTSGIPEALSAIIAAIAAVNGANKADKAEKALKEAQAATVAATTAGVFPLFRKSGKSQAVYDSFADHFGIPRVRLDDPPQIE